MQHIKAYLPGGPLTVNLYNFYGFHKIHTLRCLNMTTTFTPTRIQGCCKSIGEF